MTLKTMASLLFLIFALSVFSHAGQWIETLKEDAGKLPKHIFEQEKKIFERDPLAKYYLSQPSRRNILGRKFAERLESMTPTAARQVPETLLILALRVNFLEDTTSLHAL